MTSWKNKYININTYSRPGNKLTKVKKIIVHYTANNGATANNHYNYFNNLKGRYASAHIFVDKKEALCIIQLNEIAYHANDIQKRVSGQPYRGVPELLPNANFLSLGVEMCLESDGSFHKDTVARTEDVCVDLCKKFGLDPVKDIVRHYDVTAKICPAPWVNKPQEFTNFKNRVKNKLQGTSTSPQAPKPTQKPSVKTYKVVKSINGYINAIDAKNKKNKKTTVKKGTYHVFKESQGMINVASKQGVAGSWINPSENVIVASKPSASTPTTTKKYTSIVDYLNANKIDSSINNRKKLATKYGIKNYTGTASQNTQLLNAMQNGKAPVQSAPSQSVTFKVGAKVKIKSSAKKYSRANVNIPSSVKNKTYTIQQVGNNDVLLKEIVSWVKKTDVQ